MDAVVVAVLSRQPGWNARHLGTSPYGIATYRLEGAASQWLFLKVSPRSDRHLALHAEVERTLWAADYLPVPKVIDHGGDGEFDWLLTLGIDAPDGTSPALTADPAALVETLAAGLCRFHEVPIQACPFDFRIDAARSQVERRIAARLAVTNATRRG